MGSRQQQKTKTVLVSLYDNYLGIQFYIVHFI